MNSYQIPFVIRSRMLHILRFVIFASHNYVVFQRDSSCFVQSRDAMDRLDSLYLFNADWYFCCDKDDNRHVSTEQ